jgi:hypothetical protein
MKLTNLTSTEICIVEVNNIAVPFYINVSFILFSFVEKVLNWTFRAFFGLFKLQKFRSFK